MKKPYDRLIFLRAVKTLVRVTLFDSFRIRPPSIYGAPGMARTSAKMVVLAEKKFSPLGQKEPGWHIMPDAPCTAVLLVMNNCLRSNVYWGHVGYVY